MPTNIRKEAGESQSGDFHQPLRRQFKERMQLSVLVSKRPRKAIAADMGICQASLSDWLNPDDRYSMPAHFLAAWTREVGKGLLQWVAKENGLGIVDDEEAGPADVTDAGQLLALIAMHSGHVLSQIIQAREDGLQDVAVYHEICRLIRELEAEAEYFKPTTRIGRVS